MVDPLSVPSAQVALVLALPLLYVLHSFSPWSAAFFRDGEQGYYNHVWGATAVLHLASAAVVVAVLRANGYTVTDVGVVVPGPVWVALSALVGLGAVGTYLVDVLRAPPIVAGTIDLPRDAMIPRTASQRATCLTAGVVAAGVFEELVYRGFAIPALEGLGLPTLAALVVASVPFVFVHGLAPIKAPVLIPIYLVFGVVFGAVFLLSGSLLPGIALHGAVNAMQAVRGTRMYLGEDAGEAPGPAPSGTDG